MAVNFPASPTNGQIFTSGALTFSYNGVAWDAVGTAYAPIDSPTFTGDPKAPTPAAADNDTSVATTAFVKSTVAAIVIPPATTISDTAPGSPSVGQLWFDSTTGDLFIWYTDADSSQWVQVNSVGT